MWICNFSISKCSNAIKSALSLVGRYKKIPSDIQDTPQQISPMEEPTVEQLIASAEVCMRQRDFSEALKQWALVREKFLLAHQGYTRASAACLEIKDWQEAEKVCQLGMEKLSDNVHVFIAYAEIAMRQRDFSEALKRWALVREKFPQSYQGYARASTACRAMKDWQQAEELCLHGIKELPDNVHVFISYAEIAMQQRNFNEALKRWAIVRQKFPKAHQGYARASAACQEIKDWQQAEELCRLGIINAPTSIYPHLAMADISISQEHFQEAIFYLEHTQKLFPDNSACMNKLLYTQRVAGIQAPNASLLSSKSGMHSKEDAQALLSCNIESYDEVEKILLEQSFEKEIENVLRLYLTKKIDIRHIIQSYDFCTISLGTRCWTSRILSKACFSRHVTNSTSKLPFDLATYSADAVISILKNNFSGYADADYIIEYSDVYKNIKYDVIFNHDHRTYYRDKNHFCDVLKARVEAFKKIEGNLLYVCTISNSIYMQNFTNEQKKLLSEYIADNCSQATRLLLVEHGKNGLLKISTHVYVLQIDTQYAIAMHRLPFTMDAFTIELAVVDALCQIIQKDFPKRSVPLNFTEIDDKAKTAHHNEIFYDVQVQEFINNIKEKTGDNKNNGSIVMNCNPFTNGHKYLIEYASKQVNQLIVFVVEENKSTFDFKDRIRLVREGVKHLSNVVVVPSGKFIISTTTFPEYFFKDNPNLGKFDATNDISFFGKFIAPALHISKRFLGTEPNCQVTRQYNEQMHEILPKFGVEVEEIQRVELEGSAISASLVRKYLDAGEWEQLKELVPPTTYEFLLSRQVANEHSGD